MQGSNKENGVVSTDQDDKVILGPYHYFSQIPGKGIRSNLTKAFNFWLHVDQSKLSRIGEIVEMFHNASLLIDDIEDNSKLRRGLPAAHNIFGVATTINSANYAYFLALEKILMLNHPEAMKIATAQLLDHHRGQGMEIYWRDNYICPQEEEYKKMVNQKVGGFLELALQLMQLFSDDKTDYSTLIETLGLYFQIRDDYANLCSKEKPGNNSYCKNLTEGKFSFPIIHAIHKCPDDPRIINILRQRTVDVEIKKYCVQLLEECGSFAYTRATLDKLDNQVIAELQKFGDNPNFKIVLDELRTWKLDNDK